MTPLLPEWEDVKNSIRCKDDGESEVILRNKTPTEPKKDNWGINLRSPSEKRSDRLGNHLIKEYGADKSIIL